MNKEELLKYVTEIEEELKNIDGDEEDIRYQLIDLADNIMLTLNEI